MIRSIVAAVLLLIALVAFGQTSVEQEPEAKAVLTHYFDALAQGDTARLRSLMGGELLKKRASLLDNPTYPAHLISVYSDARIQFTRFAPRNADSIIVDVTITLSNGERLTKQFVLKEEQGDMGTRLLVHEETAVQ